jgi:hypothetical protein
MDLSRVDAVGEIILLDNTTNTKEYKLNKLVHVLNGENIYVNPAWNWGIELAKKKQASRNSDKWIVTSLFDAYLGGNVPSQKNISHYALCLYESIKIYLKY